MTTAINLNTLPPPPVIEPLTPEATLAERFAAFAELTLDVLPNWDPKIKGDLAVAHLEAGNYRETVLRQRINDAAAAVLLSQATGGDLDHIAWSRGVERHTLVPEDLTTAPPTPAVVESDEALRRRTRLAFEALSVAGPRQAYIYHALAAHPDVLDAWAASPAPGRAVITIMSRAFGVPPEQLISKVAEYLNAPDRRPLNDLVKIEAAQPRGYSIQAVLEVGEGPDSAVVGAAARANIDAFIENKRKLGALVTLGNIYAELYLAGVLRVRLLAPERDIECEKTEFPSCDLISIEVMQA